MFVDGALIGETPVTAQLAPGKHSVTLVTATGTWTRTVEIQAGKKESLTMDLQ